MCSCFRTLILNRLSDLSAITLIRLPLGLPLSLRYNISVVGGVDLLHLTAPLLPGREQCSPTGCQPDQLECLLSSKPCLQRHAHTYTHKNMQTCQAQRLNAYAGLIFPLLAFLWLLHSLCYFLPLLWPSAPSLWDRTLKHLFMFSQTHVLLMITAIYSHAVAFLEIVGSYDIHCALWCNICTLSVQGWWWLTICSLFPVVSQPDPSQEVQTAVSISW